MRVFGIIGDHSDTCAELASRNSPSLHGVSLWTESAAIAIVLPNLWTECESTQKYRNLWTESARECCKLWLTVWQVRMVLMVHVYSIESVLAVTRSHSHTAIIWETLRETYEAYVLYCFVRSPDCSTH